MLKEAWRWFGLNDCITLDDILMTGTKNIVTALYDVPIGDIWMLEDILNLKNIIESKGMKWLVVESIPVHESIKYGGNERDLYINNYIESIKNISKAGINILCYNFMPIVDWTRTNLMYKYSDNSYSLRFDIIDFLIFDLFILKRKNTENDYSIEQIKLGQSKFNSMSENELIKLKNTILKGLPGSMVDSYNLSSFKKKLNNYNKLSKVDIQNNLKYFLNMIVPIAEAFEVYLGIHPDDPPINLFGIPRVVSSLEDLNNICNFYPSKFNGLTLCVGSLASTDNNIKDIVEKLSCKVNFLHLRNVIKDKSELMNKSFTESDHLNGDIEMEHVIKNMLKKSNSQDIPFRPDHGHLMLDDINKQNINPGYSLIGRLRGLAELRGLIKGLNYK